MTITFRTVVLDVAPSPLGLTHRRFVIDHWCNECGQRVDHDELTTHARSHGAEPSSVGQGGGAID